MQHWLGDAVVDRLVFRMVKEKPGLTCNEIESRVCATLKESGLVKDVQIPPDGECIYRSLVRFVMNGKIEKYANPTSGRIEYRAQAYPRPLKSRMKGGD